MAGPVECIFFFNNRKISEFLSDVRSTGLTLVLEALVF